MCVNRNQARPWNGTNATRRRQTQILASGPQYRDAASPVRIRQSGGRMSNSHTTPLKLINTCWLTESTVAASCHAARLLLGWFCGFARFSFLGTEATLLSGRVATTSSPLLLKKLIRGSKSRTESRQKLKNRQSVCVMKQPSPSTAFSFTVSCTIYTRVVQWTKPPSQVYHLQETQQWCYLPVFMKATMSPSSTRRKDLQTLLLWTMATEKRGRRLSGNSSSGDFQNWGRSRRRVQERGRCEERGEGTIGVCTESTL